MTESDWLTATSPDDMLSHLRDGGPSDRKLRLFAVGCCRRLGARLGEAGRAVVDAVERAADGADAEADVESAAHALEQEYAAVQGAGPARRAAVLAPLAARFYAPLEAASMASTTAAIAAAGDDSGPAWAAERAAQAGLLRCIVGSPFRRDGFRPEWRTEAVTLLARGIHADDAWDRLPVLADALEEAGCDDPLVLQHCRGASTHARGCHAVDLSLGLG